MTEITIGIKGGTLRFLAAVSSILLCIKVMSPKFIDVIKAEYLVFNYLIIINNVSFKMSTNCML